MSDQLSFPVSAGAPPSDTSDATSDAIDKLSARLDRQASQDLLTIMQAAGSQTDAVKYALAVAASVCRGAWTLGYTHPRQLPTVTAWRVDVGSRLDVSGTYSVRQGA